MCMWMLEVLDILELELPGGCKSPSVSARNRTCIFYSGALS